MLENVLYVIEYIASLGYNLQSILFLYIKFFFILALMSVHKHIKQCSVNIECVNEWVNILYNIKENKWWTQRSSFTFGNVLSPVVKGTQVGCLGHG